MKAADLKCDRSSAVGFQSLFPTMIGVFSFSSKLLGFNLLLDGDVVLKAKRCARCVHGPVWKFLPQMRPYSTIDYPLIW